VEGVRRGFYVANFGYFLKSNLRNLGKTWFFMFFFSFSANNCHFCQNKKLVGKMLQEECKLEKEKRGITILLNIKM
jgi:hypothetical protein